MPRIHSGVTFLLGRESAGVPQSRPPQSGVTFLGRPAAKGPQNTRKKEARGRFSAGISRVSFERQRTEGFQWVKARGRFSARVLRVSLERGLSLVGTLLFNAPYPVRGYFLPWAQFHNRRRGARASPGLLSYLKEKLPPPKRSSVRVTFPRPAGEAKRFSALAALKSLPCDGTRLWVSSCATYSIHLPPAALQVKSTAGLHFSSPLVLCLGPAWGWREKPLGHPGGPLNPY